MGVSVMHPIIRNALIGGGSGGGAPSTPATILGSDLLVWYDRTNLSSMFQDSAGTTPVTAGGQPVGRMLDLSGNGRHAIQPTAASRCLLSTDGGKNRIIYDGVDDSYYTESAVNLSAHSAITVFFAYHKLTNGDIRMLVETSPHVTTGIGSFAVVMPISTGHAINVIFNSGTADYGQVSALAGAAASLKMVGTVTIKSNVATVDEAINIRINGSVVANELPRTYAPSGAFGNHVMYMGRRANSSLPLLGEDYGFILAAGDVPLDKKQAIESYLNSKIGAY